MGSPNSKLTGHRASIESVRARKHCDIFVKGMNAALEGRYTESELCFHQVIFKHPTFLEHTQLLVMLDRSMRSAAQASTPSVQKPNSSAQAVSGSPQQGEGAPIHPITAWERSSSTTSETVSSGTSSTAAGDPVNTASPGSSPDRVVEIPLPTGNNLTVLLELMQMQQDIEHIYIACNTEKADRLAMLYAELNCVWMQLNVFFVAQMRKEREGVNNVAMGGNARRQTVHIGTSLDDAHVMEAYLDLLEQTLRYFLVCSSVNYGTLAFNYAVRLENVEDKPSAATKPTPQNRSVAMDEEERMARLKRMRRQRRIFHNIRNLCQVVLGAAQDTAERYPDEYVSRVLLKVMPRLPVRNDATSAEGSPRSTQSPRQQNGSRRPRAVRVWPTTGIPASPADRHPPQSGFSPTDTSESTSNQSQSEHLLSRMAKLFVAYSQGKGGGTFLVESRTVTPVAPVVLFLSDMKLPMRLVISDDQRVTKADLEQLVSPHQRVTWESIAWTLPTETTFSGHGYPMTADFLLCNALPQFYTSVQKGSDNVCGDVSNRFAAWRGKAAMGIARRPAAHADAYIQSLIDYTRSEDAVAAISLNAAEEHRQTSRHSAVANRHVDIRNPLMRRAACLDETATCLKMLYILLAKVLKRSGLVEESKDCATAAVLQTVCMRGPASPERLRMHSMLAELGLL